MSAQVDAHGLATGFVKEPLTEPSNEVKDPSLWPKQANTAAVTAAKEESWAMAVEMSVRDLRQSP